jgi:hypothetical protein
LSILNTSCVFNERSVARGHHLPHSFHNALNLRARQQVQALAEHNRRRTMANIIEPMPRRTFVAFAGASIALATRPTHAASPDTAHAASGTRFFPQHDPSLVSAVVGASHRSIERVTELVEARPELAKASWDWGFGDWESALGAASHTGRREIALFLLKHGARPNLFTLAMLGKVDAVRAIIESHPGAQRTLGPHGITLLRHARAGRDNATDVVAYLEELGGADDGQTSVELTAEQIETHLGSFQSEPTGPFEITERRGMVMIKPEGGTIRTLFLLDDGSFHPTGAPSVRIRFRFTDGRASAVLFSNPDGEPIVAGRV